MTRYGLLNYVGDLTGNDEVQPSQILGHDEIGHPYEVLDADFRPCEDCDGTDRACSSCRGRGGRTRVYLQHATPDNIRAALAKGLAQLRGGAS